MPCPCSSHRIQWTRLLLTCLSARLRAEDLARNRYKWRGRRHRSAAATQSTRGAKHGRAHSARDWFMCLAPVPVDPCPFDVPVGKLACGGLHRLAAGTQSTCGGHDDHGKHGRAPLASDCKLRFELPPMDGRSQPPCLAPVALMLYVPRGVATGSGFTSIAPTFLWTGVPALHRRRSVHDGA